MPDAEVTVRMKVSRGSSEEEDPKAGPPASR
jgi:hypothetical protein